MVLHGNDYMVYMFIPNKDYSQHILAGLAAMLCC